MPTADQIITDVLQWITGFVESPNAALKEKIPCPFAREARLRREIYFTPVENPTLLNETIAAELDCFPHSGTRLTVIATPKMGAPVPEQLFSHIAYLREVWAPKDVYIMVDHPNAREEVQGVSFNQGTYVLILIQKLSELLHASDSLHAQGYYDGWPRDYFEEVVGRRALVAKRHGIKSGIKT